MLVYELDFTGKSVAKKNEKDQIVRETVRFPGWVHESSR